MRTRTTLTLLALLLAARPASATRIKDLADVEGFRTNALTGLGVVVGLNNTGDDPSAFSTRRPLSALFRHLGSVIDPNDIRARNVALVMVTANLPPFARPGMSIDVTVASAGTARSLVGGTLIATPLKGADRQTWAIAQGPLTIGGFVASGLSGSVAAKNHVTTARIPGGAVIEREVVVPMPEREVNLILRDPDFTTAARMAEAINKALSGVAARVRDPGSLVVPIPTASKDNVVQFIADIEAIDIKADSPARVVIDERNGTVVVGANVSVGPAAVAHGGLSVSVSEQPAISQPNALGQGQTQVVPQTVVQVDEKDGKMQVVPASATVDDIAKALNALGVKPRDLISILQALKAAGALRGEIQVL